MWFAGLLYLLGNKNCYTNLEHNYDNLGQSSKSAIFLINS